MHRKQQSEALTLLDELVSEGRTQFTSSEVATRLDRSRAATGNLLTRLVRAGLLDRVRRGHFAIRQLGLLGTPAAAESVLLSVAAGFGDGPHRVAYLTALDQLDLLTHPTRTIQIALTKPTRSRKLSGRKLTVVREPEGALGVGAVKRDGVLISDLERSLLDAAARPDLVPTSALVEALGAAASKGVNAERLTAYACALSWGPALRRIGSLSDRLHIPLLAGRLQPIGTPTSDIDLEPGRRKRSAYRDAHWWVRWHHTPSELQNVVRQ